MKKIEFFKVEGDRINRIRKHCPKCGPAVFLAEHKNRLSCGKCGYAEFKGGGKPPKPPKTEDKTVEQPIQEKPDSSKGEISVETSTNVPDITTVEKPPAEGLPVEEPQVKDSEETLQTEQAQELSKEEKAEPELKEEEPPEQPEKSDTSHEKKQKKESIEKENKE